MKICRDFLLLGMFVIVLVVAGIWIYQIWCGYQDAVNEYEELRKYVVEKGLGKDGDSDGNIQGPGGQERELLSVDFDKLKK